MTNKKSENRVPSTEKEEEKIELTVEEFNKLKEQFEEMKALLGNSGSGEKEEVLVVEESQLRPDNYISVLSLCPFTLSLSTEGFGRGKNFTFRRFGEKKKILYSDLVLIMENQTGFLEAGYFYILDSRVIRQHGLDELYEKLLDKDQFEKLFSNEYDVESCMEIYNGANDRQKKIIERMLVKILSQDGDINKNLASAISSASGNDLFELAKELKENGVN